MNCKLGEGRKKEEMGKVMDTDISSILGNRCARL